MTVKCFFCLGPDRGLDIPSLLMRWSTEPVELILLTCQSPSDNRDRRIRADEMGDAVYILADDDCVPDVGVVEEGLKILRDHPEFAILSLWPENATIHEWRGGSDYRPLSTGEVMEHVSVGGVRFCRKGLLTEWPEQAGRGYDREQCDALRAAGWRVGYFKNLSMHHLGEGNSTVWT